jgi:hypothetical protein
MTLYLLPYFGTDNRRGTHVKMAEAGFPEAVAAPIGD